MISICCEVAEESAEEIIRAYSIDMDTVEDDDIDQSVIDYLEENTTYIGKTNVGFIYVQF